MASMMKGPPPPGGNVDVGPRISAMFLTLSISASLVVALRLGLRLKEHHLGMDDLFALISAASFIGIAADVSYGAAHGAYQTGYYLTDSQLELSLLVNTIGEALTPIAAGSMKISIALMLLRLIGRTARWQKWFLWALITSTAIISIITVFVTFFQCGNPQAIWNVALKAETTCSDLSVFVNEVFFVSAWYAAVDFILALFPVLIIYKLNMSLGKKIALSGLLGLGLVTGVIASLKASLIPILGASGAGAFYEFELHIFVGVEIFSLIVLGCVPMFKRPAEYILKNIDTILLTPIRRLLSRNSTVYYTDKAMVDIHGFTRHEEAAYVLQNTAGANFSHVKTTDGDSSRGELPGALPSHGKNSDDELQENEIQIEHTFGVV